MIPKKKVTVNLGRGDGYFLFSGKLWLWATFNDYSPLQAIFLFGEGISWCAGGFEEEGRTFSKSRKYGRPDKSNSERIPRNDSQKMYKKASATTSNYFHWSPKRRSACTPRSAYFTRTD